jgi:SAM-dependent methyltransferase
MAAPNNYDQFDASLLSFDVGSQFDALPREERRALLEEGGFALPFVDRSADPLYEDFGQMDGHGPRGALAEKCEALGDGPGTVTVLDAGCGTGYQALDLARQVISLHDIPASRFLVDAVSDFDFSRLSDDRQTRVAIGAGFINYVVADLNTFKLPSEAYDVAYSYEVLTHNGQPELIMDNVWQSLRPGGVGYLNASGEQAHLERWIERYRRQGGLALSQQIMHPGHAYGLPNRSGQTRWGYKLVKPL